MGIWDRFTNVVNSYINDIGGRKREWKNSNSYSGDPDLDAAYEELDDYLNGKEQNKNTRHANVKLPPEELRPDFEYLGLPFGADAEECKAAYKRLLKIHHPDRHAGHEGNMKKATEKSAKINAAWERIEKWRKGAS
ncbi:MAG: J domain-containing protein [Treponema sp.]|jgi:DnaJ-domain-containing protein 1|nr:J domain-containing protein [Treponema sp.]